MKTLLIVLSIFCVACQSGIGPQGSTMQEAKLVNNLAVDGCSWHFTVDFQDQMGRFVPNDATQAKMEKIIEKLTTTNGLYQVDVRISYKLTGNNKEILCGWNKMRSFEEIEILSLELK